MWKTAIIVFDARRYTELAEGGLFIIDKDRTACFTGHRDIPASEMVFIKKRLKKELEKLIEKGVIFFGSGGAVGFDTLAALTVLELKKKHPRIKLIMVLPCKEQDRKWNETDKKIYADILGKADKIVYTSEHYHKACMFVRNRRLVDFSSYCIAYLKEDTGGTAYTVDYALKNRLEVVNIAERGSKK